jgi:predicted RNase H-like HicB family nuclease
MDVLSYLASGLSPQQITTTYPALTEADVHACLAFAADREHGLGRTDHSNDPHWLDSQHHVSAEGTMHLTLEVDREEDGRWIAEVPDLAGVLAYGQTRDEAIARAEALALRVLADRLEHGEAGPDLVSVSFRAA